MIKKLTLATNNKGKKTEIRNLLEDVCIEIVDIEGDFNPVENGGSFYKNALIKAKEAAKITGLPALGDDSGLSVDILGGLPGIHSSRFAENDEKRIERVLEALKYCQTEERGASFICCTVIVSAEGEELFSCTEKCSGVIIDAPKGDNGFGYDPIFFMTELNKTMAELTLEEKNNISHRAKALKKTISWLKEQQPSLA